MFAFIKNLFKRKIKVRLSKPEEPKPLSHPIDTPKCLLESRGDINCSDGHIDFGKTKSITRSFKRNKIKESFEERRNRYYDESGILFDE